MSAENAETGPDTGSRRPIANAVLALVWVYVALIWLLALDQQFHWGIF